MLEAGYFMEEKDLLSSQFWRLKHSTSGEELPGKASAWGKRGLCATRRNHTVSSEGKGGGLPCCRSLSQALTQGRSYIQDPSDLPLGFGSTTFTHSHSGLTLASCIFQGLVVTHSLAHVCLFLLLSSALQMVGGFLLSCGSERGGLTGLGDCSILWAFLPEILYLKDFQIAFF